MISMELQPAVHLQHLSHHGLVSSHGTSSLSSQAGQHHLDLIHLQQHSQPPHIPQNQRQDEKLKSKPSFYYAYHLYFQFTQPHSFNAGERLLLK